MLMRLLEIKRRREQGLRAQLARLDREKDELMTRLEQVKAKRVALYEQWRELSARQGQFSQSELGKLRIALSKTEVENKRLQQQVADIDTEKDRLAQCRTEQEGILRKNLREQEKLAYMVESS
ncbi:type III secretion protein [Dyella sp. M7H15-1]|uniref:type III secretion protein n=1 Tax=Dyella sp. M7H15-1 TaxID=2501295 RepID=UPI001004E5AD|nr:type III secretion protein [Dyella sp. M7H15-1]QAU24334.1 type III secretion protein [Dyella sp. M7H15-1]